MNSNTLKENEKPELSVRDSFCIHPFKSINIMPAGNIKPCCAFVQPIKKDNREMSVYEHSLEDVWNSNEMREIRRDMTEGAAVAGCEYCYQHEQQGIRSMREEANTGWEAGYLNIACETIDELKTHAKDHDFRVPSGPEHLDLDVGNLCNLKCRMCNSTYSSGIAADPVHSRWSWSSSSALARWQGSTSIIAPNRVIGVAYEGLGYPDQTVPAGTAWTDGDAAVRLTLQTVDLAGFAVQLSAEKPDNLPLTITANGEVVFHGILPTGAWASSFDFPFPAGSGELELRFQSPVFRRQFYSDPVGVGIDELKLLRSKADKNSVMISRFSSGKQWFQDHDFLIKELLSNPESIKKIRVIGGEPLLIKEVRLILQHLVDIGVAKQITLALSTNGMFADDEWFALVANFLYVYVGVSVDGVGSANEYIRFPSQWETVTTNLRKFSVQPNSYVYVNDTIQAYNILDITNLIDFCKELDIPFRFYLLDRPSHLSVSVLPVALRLEASRRLRSYQTVKTSLAASSIEIANGIGIQQLISALEEDSLTVDINEVRNFMMFTNDLDLSRGQNINNVFPELVQRLADAGFPWISDIKFSK